MMRATRPLTPTRSSATFGGPAFLRSSILGWGTWSKLTAIGFSSDSIRRSSAARLRVALRLLARGSARQVLELDDQGGVGGGDAGVGRRLAGVAVALGARGPRGKGRGRVDMIDPHPQVLV